MQNQRRDNIQKIKNNLRKTHDPDILKKVYLILKILESQRSIASACAFNGIPRRNFYRWLSRLKASDFDLNTLRNKSRRPKYSPNKTSKEIEDRLLKLRENNADKGGKYIAKLILDTQNIKIAGSTVDMIFKRRGVVKPKRKPKPNPHTKRYSCKKPLERVQFDSVSLGIEDSNGNKVCAITAIDDCTRYLAMYVCHTKGAIEAAEALKRFVEEIGKPKCIQTDNGVEFTCRYNSFLNSRRQKEAKLSGFEMLCQQHGIRHYLIRPRTPQLNGKVERFHRNMRKEFNLDYLDGKPFDFIVKYLKQKVAWYNNNRYHYSLKLLTPHQKFQQSMAA